MKPDIVRRYRHNPILTKAEIPYPVETVHNAAVVKHENEYIMLFRSHLRTGRSIIGLARSTDGFHFTADPEPFLIPARDSPFAAYEEFGVEDPRVTRLEGERSEEHTSELQSRLHIVCRLLLEKKKIRGSSLRRPVLSSRNDQRYH